MKRVLAVVGAVLLPGLLLSLAVAPAAAQRAPAKSSSTSKAPWAAPRMPWGDPDIAGIFTTDDELGVPFERPEQFGNYAMTNILNGARAEEINAR